MGLIEQGYTLIKSPLFNEAGILTLCLQLVFMTLNYNPVSHNTVIRLFVSFIDILSTCVNLFFLYLDLGNTIKSLKQE